MHALLWIATAVLAINAAQSYILLTANLEDVQSIAKQMIQSPIAEQIKKIWRRASNEFKHQVGGRVHKRAEDEENNISKEEPSRKDEEDQGGSSGADRDSSEQSARRQGADIAELGKNASFYLSSIKEVMEKI